MSPALQVRTINSAVLALAVSASERWAGRQTPLFLFFLDSFLSFFLPLSLPPPPPCPRWDLGSFTRFSLSLPLHQPYSSPLPVPLSQGLLPTVRRWNRGSCNSPASVDSLPLLAAIPSSFSVSKLRPVSARHDKRRRAAHRAQHLRFTLPWLPPGEGDHLSGVDGG